MDWQFLPELIKIAGPLATIAIFSVHVIYRLSLKILEREKEGDELMLRMLDKYDSSVTHISDIVAKLGIAITKLTTIVDERLDKHND